MSDDAKSFCACVGAAGAAISAVILSISIPLCMYHYEVNAIAMKEGYEQRYERGSGWALGEERGEKQVRQEENVLEIDQYRLDKEWVRQAKLYHAYALKLADARMALNEANDTLEVVYAEQDRDVRLHPEKHGLSKITEPVVKNAVIVTAAYREACRVVIQCKHDVSINEAYVQGLDHKKRALEKLVDLALSDFYGEPRAPKGKYREVEALEASAAFNRKK